MAGTTQSEFRFQISAANSSAEPRIALDESR
jgi:hypothetical protein